jgi:hypothetical protein
MVQIFVYLSFIFIAIKVIKEKSHKRVLWFIIGEFMIPPGVTIGGKPLSWLLTLVLIISLFFDSDKFKKIKYLPLRRSFLIYFICLLFIGLLDERISLIQKIIRPIQYFYENSLPCILIYIALFRESNYRKLYKSLLFAVTYFAIYGIVCFIFKNNIYIDLLSNSFNFRNLALEYLSGSDNRIRISSVFFHPFLYGIVLVFFIGIGIVIFQNSKKTITRNLIITILILLFFNLLLTNSRTVLIVLILQIGFYTLFQINNKNISIVSLFVFFMYLMITFIPFLKEKSDLILDLAQSGGKKVEGSSIEMREVQLLASYKYFLQKPISGNGFNYIYEGLGFRTEIKNRSSESELYAFESYFYFLLIEQGVIGILGNLVLFVSVITYSLKNYFKIKIQNGKKYVIYSLLMIITYLIFILSTGTINSMPYFFSLLGISLSLQQKLTSNQIPFENKIELI